MLVIWYLWHAFAINGNPGTRKVSFDKKSNPVMIALADLLVAGGCELSAK
jgi:hypothetical protein